jgi:hypothetical protein
MDLNRLDFKTKDVNFGSYIGQEIALRKLCIARYGHEKVAEMTDRDLEDVILRDGFIPVVINGLVETREQIFLIKKEILLKAEQLKR